MKRRHRDDPGPGILRPYRMLMMALVTGCLLGVCAHTALAAEVLLLKQDDSKILTFQKMKRVWVTNPEVIDVQVSSYNELLLYSKTAGRTKLYVWDAKGRHEYAVQVTLLPSAEQAVRRLSNLLGRSYTYTIVDDQTILVEGDVATEAEKERVGKIIAAQSDGLKVLDLVIVSLSKLTPAEEHRRAFEKLFPQQFRYSSIDDKTLVIEGEVGTAEEKRRVEKILEAAKAIEVVDLVRSLEGMNTPEEQRIASIQQAIGDEYEYLTLEGSILVVSGEASSDQEKSRIDKIIDAAGADVTVINVVAVKSDDRSPAVKYAELLKPLFAQGYTFTPVGDDGLVAEGVAATPQEASRVEEVLALLDEKIDIVNLIKTAPQDPTQRALAMLAKSLGERYEARLVADDVILVEGIADSESESQRVDAIIKAAPEGTTVVNAVGKAGLTPAGGLAKKYGEALKPLLGDTLTYRVLDDNTLIVEGELDTAGEKERAASIISALGDVVSVLDLVTVKPGPDAMAQSAAARKAEAIGRMLGDKYDASALDENTVVVRGVAPGKAEQERIGRLLADVAGDLTVVNMVLSAENVATKTPAERAMEMLKDGLGPDYTVRTVAGDVVIVDGAASSDEELNRVDLLIQAAPEDATVVNLVSKGAAKAYADALKSVLGVDLTYTAIDENTLLVEGQVTTAGQKARATEILGSLGEALTVLDMITVKPGPGAMEQSEADIKAKAITQMLGGNYTAKAIDESTVLVEGAAPGKAEQERLAGILDKVAGDLTVVNMILPGADAGLKSPAERMIAALKPIVPESLKLVVLDSESVLIEGIVPTTIDKERVDKIAEASAKSGSVNVMSLVMTEMQSKTPAARRIEHLKKILGDEYNYIVWDDDTVLVEGNVDSQAELERVQKILKAADEDFKVGDIVTYGDSGEAGEPDARTTAIAEQISKAIGEPYRVWALKTGKIVVEGAATDQGAVDRLTQLLEAFKDDAEIVNLVSVSPQPTVSLVARAESLRSVLGDTFQVRTLQGRAVIVEGVTTDKEGADRVQSIIDAMGTEVPIVNLVTVADPAKRQIIAHVKVLDINRGYLKKHGINWGQLTGGADEVSFADQPFLIRVEEGINNINPFGANIDLLKQTDFARVLAEPNLVVNDGEEASIVVGGEIPIPVPQLGTGATSVTIQYKEYGVVLRMKPQIMSDGTSIRLEIEPEVSSIDSATQVSIGGIAVPAFRTRKAKTTVDMPDGATLVIGGLLQRDQTKVVRRIPILSKLPIIGSLFTSKEWRSGYSELVILVTPEILQTAKP